MKTILMGCSGWISHYLASEFTKRAPAASMVGTYHKKKPAFDFPMMALSISDHHRMLDLMTREEPTAIVNLTRGESEADFNLHKKLIEFVFQRLRRAAGLGPFGDGVAVCHQRVRKI